jgi:hypothetical protein
MTPQQFISKWGPGGPSYDLNEEQGAQSHFLDLCEMLNVPKPGTEAGYLFENKNIFVDGKMGYADVFRQGNFAWENKAPGKNLDVALKQLLTYSLAMSNPPLLIVCDRNIIRIHTQFTGHPSETHIVRLDELDQPDKQALLRRIWTDPGSFRPKKTSRDITEEAAQSFATLAEQLRNRGRDSEEVAHFLTQCLFCFFAEDVGLLPGRMFERLVNNRQLTSDKLTLGLENLFTVMGVGGLYGPDDIHWFNGDLFKKVAVPRLQILDVTELRNAAAMNWAAIDVSIFGTLFERGLDPRKRSQLGTHYTDPVTIMRIVEPVVQRPLREAWDQTAQKLTEHMGKVVKRNDKHHKAAKELFASWLEQLAAWRVLDPACGSGNFLFLALKALKEIEHKSHLEAAALGLDRPQDLVTGPENVLGIEINEYAAELARVTVWIGELQWRLAHGFDFKIDPVLQPLHHIECRDALLTEQTDSTGLATYVESSWPKATVVVGNPPFLGGSKKRRELGDEKFEALASVYAGRVPSGADLVCYWFDKALRAIEDNGLGAAGLVATNSIRGGANRKVLDAIQQRSHFSDAWSDEAWVNEGAAVRVSLICFGNIQGARLNGIEVGNIYSDLSAGHAGGASLDLRQVRPLPENVNASFQGSQKIGPFDISGEQARQWLRLPNPHGRSNAEVLRPSWNGLDITGLSRDGWIIDFGITMPQSEAALFEAPYDFVLRNVKPERDLNNRESYRKWWWRHGEPRIAMRAALSSLPRYFATSAHAKHFFFAWIPAIVLPDKALIVIARADDATFGILQSRFHEVWSLRMGTSLEDRPRYTPTTCFETFPFPHGLTPADTSDLKILEVDSGAFIPASLTTEPVKVAARAIARAAKRLTDLRQAWLQPHEWTVRVPEIVPIGLNKSPYPDLVLPKRGYETQLAGRALNKLYNVKPEWLVAAHQDLNMAVANSYGWTDYKPDMSDDEIVRRLMVLNAARASGP